MKSEHWYKGAPARNIKFEKWERVCEGRGQMSEE